MSYAYVTDENIVELPSGDDVRTGDVVHSYETLLVWTEQERNKVGVFTIVEPDPPADDEVIASTALEVQNGQCVRVASYAPIPLQQAKTARHAAVVANREAMFAAGFSPSSGPLAGHTLQVRNETDKINWLTSATSYSAAVAAGAGAVPGATFRTAANETVVVTFAQGLTVIVQQMAAWGAAIMARSWALKDEIEAVSDLTALAAIDINAGWPE